MTGTGDGSGGTVDDDLVDQMGAEADARGRRRLPGAIDAVMRHWASTGITASVTDTITSVLQRLASILPGD